MTALEALLCWLNRPRRSARRVVDTADGPALAPCCPSCQKDHA